MGSTYGWGYTLYYATNFMFTGLAVAVAFHAKPVQHRLAKDRPCWAGWAWRMVCLDDPVAALVHRADRGDRRVNGAAVFGAAWAAVPAYLQAKRGSHIVITTIMFNFIAAAVLNYVLVNLLRPARVDGPGHRDDSPKRCTSAHAARSAGALLRIAFSKAAPANISFLVVADHRLRSGVGADLAHAVGV